MENQDFLQPEAEIMEQEGETVQQNTLQHEEQVKQETVQQDPCSMKNK